MYYLANDAKLGIFNFASIELKEVIKQVLQLYKRLLGGEIISDEEWREEQLYYIEDIAKFDIKNMNGGNPNFAILGLMSKMMVWKHHNSVLISHHTDRHINCNPSMLSSIAVMHIIRIADLNEDIFAAQAHSVSFALKYAKIISEEFISILKNPKQIKMTNDKITTRQDYETANKAFKAYEISYGQAYIAMMAAKNVREAAKSAAQAANVAYSEAWEVYSDTTLARDASQKTMLEAAILS
jgi:hypothetical protein